MKHKWCIPLLALLTVFLISAVKTAGISEKRQSGTESSPAVPASVSYQWKRPYAKELLFRLDSRCHPCFPDELTYHPLNASGAAELLALPESEFSRCVEDAFYSCADDAVRAHRTVVFHCKDAAAAEELSALLEKSSDGSGISAHFLPDVTVSAVCGDMVLLVSSTGALAENYLRLFAPAVDESL